MEAFVTPRATPLDGYQSIPSGPCYTCAACSITTRLLLAHGFNPLSFLNESADWVSTEDRCLWQKLSLALYQNCLAEMFEKLRAFSFTEHQQQEYQASWNYPADGLQKLDTGLGVTCPVEYEWMLPEYDLKVHLDHNDPWGASPPITFGLPDSSTPDTHLNNLGPDSDGNVDNADSAYGGEWGVPMPNHKPDMINSPETYLSSLRLGGDGNVDNDYGAYGGKWEVPMSNYKLDLNDS